MKPILILFFTLTFFFTSAQKKHVLGIAVGATEYTSEIQELTTKTSTGFTVGLIGNFILSKRSELFLSLKYNQHSVIFLGRESESSSLEDIKFNLNQFEVPFIYNYNVIKKNKFAVGLNAGVSLNVFYEYKLQDSGQADYLIQPLGVTARRLFFDSKNEAISINAFAIGGIRTRINEHFLLTLQYNHGLTNPFRQAPETNPISGLEVKDSYYSLSLAYLF